MAITEKPFFNPWDTPGVQVEEFAIGGKLIIANISLSTLETVQHWDDESWRNGQRQRLVNLLASRILAYNLTEITAHEDLVNGHQVIPARCYLAPNDQVKVLGTLTR